MELIIPFLSSLLGFAAALIIGELYLQVRRHAPQLVGYLGFAIGSPLAVIALIFLPSEPGLIIPFLVFAVIIGCQRKRTPSMPLPLLESCGILVAESLAVLLANFVLQFFLENLYKAVGRSNVQPVIDRMILALLVSLFLRETMGPIQGPARSPR